MKNVKVYTKYFKIYWQDFLGTGWIFRWFSTFCNIAWCCSLFLVMATLKSVANFTVLSAVSHTGVKPSTSEQNFW